jgi:hypothetical protein
LIRELGIELVASLDTHVHADHGLAGLGNQLPGSLVGRPVRGRLGHQLHAPGGRTLCYAVQL